MIIISMNRIVNVYKSTSTTIGDDENQFPGMLLSWTIFGRERRAVHSMPFAVYVREP